jgi:predicted negative regulator of RcsB-dependent stress response
MSETESAMETTENGWNVREENAEQDALIGKLKMLGYALVGILAIGFGYYFYSGMQETTNEEAMTALSRISSYYESGQFQKALDGDPSRTIRGGKVIGLKAIVSEYGGTPAGAFAALYAGSSLVNIGKYSEALPYLETASASDDATVSAGGKAGMAACNEELKNYEEAASLYIEAAGTKDSPLYERYTLFAALNYEKASANGSGEAKEKAITLLKGLTMKNSGSDYTNEAKMGLARLGWHEN